VHDLALQPLYDGAEFEMSFRGYVRFEQRNVFEVCRQWPDLGDLLGRTDQEVLIGMVQSSERTDNIPGVGAKTELGNPAYIDGDLHEMI